MGVQPNIEKKDSPEDWRYREAATLAFSSILEGPSYQSLAGVTNAGLSFLLNATKDPNTMVRQTTAWTLGMYIHCHAIFMVQCPVGHCMPLTTSGVHAVGRVFQFVHGEEEVATQGLVTSQNLPGIVSVLLQSMNDEPYIAEQICVALSQLSVGFKDADASPFSPYFADSIQALLQQVSTISRQACQIMHAHCNYYNTDCNLQDCHCLTTLSHA